MCLCDFHIYLSSYRFFNILFQIKKKKINKKKIIKRVYNKVTTIKLQ